MLLTRLVNIIAGNSKNPDLLQNIINIKVKPTQSIKTVVKT
jgi:hypothetical protein